MPTQMANWDSVDAEFRATRIQRPAPRNQRYLPVFTKRLQRRVDPILALSVDCPKGQRVGIDVCVECPHARRLRYHGRGRPMALECTVGHIARSAGELALVAESSSDGHCERAGLERVG